MALTKTAEWRKQNEIAIKERLSPLLPLTDLATIIPSQIQGIFVRRIDDILELYCYDPESRDLSNIMSKVNLTAPLDLISTYSQVMFLTHVWQKKPAEHIYIAGFGGGRLAMLPHHYSPDVLIDGSDFDPAILETAASHFGIHYDARYSVNAADSAEDFSKRNAVYDIIIIDVFSSSGAHASHLASTCFFDECRSKLTRHGVVAINLLQYDTMLDEKIESLKKTFPHILEWKGIGSHLLFASQVEVTPSDIITRAQAFEVNAKLTFPYAEHAQALTQII